MRIIYILLTLLTYSHCYSQEPSVVPQKDRSGHLVGVINMEILLESPFSNWFRPRHKAYRIQTMNLKKLKVLFKDVKIKVFMATWCKESKARVPILIKILDVVDFDFNDLQLIAVDKRKKTPEKLEKGYDLIRIPTFIFYRNDTEIGRFVEDPRTTIEADIIKILKGKPYKPSHSKK